MAIIVTNKGHEVECDRVIRPMPYDILHIYTHSISPIEAYQIFGDPEESSVLTVHDTGDIKIYRGFIEVYSVRKDYVHSDPNEILIWLEKPSQPDEEVIPNAE